MKRKYFNERRMRESAADFIDFTQLERIYFHSMESDYELLVDVIADGIRSENAERVFQVLHRIKGAAATAHAYSIQALAHVATKALIARLYDTCDFNVGYLLEEMEIALQFKPSNSTKY